MPKFFGRDDSFSRAIGTFTAKRFEFVLMRDSQTQRALARVSFATVCGADDRMYWIFDLRPLFGDIGTGPPAIIVFSGGPGRALPYKEFGKDVVVAEDPKTRVYLRVRIHDTSPIAANPDYVDNVKYGMNAEFDRRATFCRIQDEALASLN